MLRGKNLKIAIESGSVATDATVRKDSLLVSLGSTYQQLAPLLDPVDPYNSLSIQDGCSPIVDQWDELEVDPGSYVLFSSAEWFSLDHNHFGLLTTLSHVARLGIMAHPSSFFIDPEFSGHVTLEIANLAPFSIRLRRGMPVAKIIILRCQDTFGEGHFPRPTFHYGNPADLCSKFPEEFSQEAGS